MRLSPAAWVLVAAVCVPAPARAQAPGDPDAEGCKDSALLTRIPGCTITSCDKKDFDAAELLSGPYSSATSDFPKKSLEGAVETIQYICPSRISLLQIARNAENALRQAGFAVVYSGKGVNDYPTVTMQSGAQWIGVVAEQWNEFSSYRQTAVKVQGMAQEMKATAEGLAAEIQKSGHVAVYGIHFDTGKVTITPDSDAVLGEIVKLLKANPGWKMRVEGHTDNVGAKAANQTLSQQRAEAVVSWLAAHGIERARLSAQGFGDTRPVGENSTEEGRARNRRVELAKIG